MFTKWAATSPFGTEPKTVVSSLIQLLGNGNIAICAQRPRLNIVTLLIQLLEKGQHRHLGTEPKTYLNMSNAGKIWQRYEDIASMI